MKKATVRYLLIMMFSWLSVFLVLAFGLIPLVFTLACLLFLASVLLIIKAIFTGIKEKRKSYFLYALIIPVIIGSSIVAANRVAEYQEKETIKTSGIIIKALERYKEQQQEYPEKPEDLVPQYLKELPSTVYSLHFERWYNGKGYTISFGRPLILMYRFDSISKCWEEFNLIPIPIHRVFR